MNYGRTDLSVSHSWLIAGHGHCPGANVLLSVLTAELNELRRGVGLLEHRLHVEFAHHRLLFLGRLRELTLLTSARGVNSVDGQAVGLVVEFDAVVVGEDLVAAMLLVPFSDRRVLVHVLYDVAPADTGVVGAETDLAFLGAVRDDAHLGAAEVVIEQVLEPHARDEKEVPAILAALYHVINGAVRRGLAIILARKTEGLVELLQQVEQLEVRRRAERVIVLKERQRHHRHRELLAARSV